MNKLADRGGNGEVPHLKKRSDTARSKAKQQRVMQITDGYGPKFAASFYGGPPCSSSTT